jgi:hypothetical protein
MMSEDQPHCQNHLEEHKQTARFESQLDINQNRTSIEEIRRDESVQALIHEESKVHTDGSMRREPYLIGTP